MSRRVYFRIKSFTADPSTYEVSAIDFEVYTSASHAEAGTANEEITNSSRTSDGGNYYTSSYTNTNRYPQLTSMFPTGSNTGGDAYELYFYNATGSTIYFSTDSSTSGFTSVSNSSWSISTSGNGHNAWGTSGYSFTFYNVNSFGAYDAWKHTIVSVSPLGTSIYMYITGRSGTATSTTSIDYQLFADKNNSTDLFVNKIATDVSNGTSLSLENSFTPIYATGATYQNTSVNPSNFYIFVNEDNYEATSGDTYRFYISPSQYDSTQLVQFYSESGFTPNPTDGEGTPDSSKTTYSAGLYSSQFNVSNISIIWATTHTDTSPSGFFTFQAVCFPPFTLIETPHGLTQIGDLKVGDKVKTQRGIVKVSKNMTTHTPGGATFVFFPKDCICEGFPSEDAYITEFHPIAIKNVEEDNKDVMHFIEARHFINKFKGIELKTLETKTYHNLVFDTVEIFNVGGMKMCSHHPNNTPIKLRKDEFLGEVNERIPINKRYTFEKLSEDKKEDEDLGEYLKKILKYN